MSATTASPSAKTMMPLPLHLVNLLQLPHGSRCTLVFDRASSPKYLASVPARPMIQKKRRHKPANLSPPSCRWSSSELPAVAVTADKAAHCLAKSIKGTDNHTTMKIMKSCSQGLVVTTTPATTRQSVDMGPRLPKRRFMESPTETFKNNAVLLPQDTVSILTKALEVTDLLASYRETM